MAVLIETGLVDYEAGLALQRLVWGKRVKREVEDTLILLEHPPVITIGRRADKRHLLVVETTLEQRGIRVYQIERGGDITYHGPGQLIGYLIFHLKEGLVGVRRFIENIEQALIKALGEFNIRAHTKERLIGVWVKDKKIASIGVAFKDGVSMHGFALNVKRDLSGFQLINPCGLSAEQMTSMEMVLNREVDPNAVRSAVRIGLEAVFGFVFQKNLPLSLTSLTNFLSSAHISSTSLRE